MLSCQCFGRVSRRLRLPRIYQKCTYIRSVGNSVTVVKMFLFLLSIFHIQQIVEFWTEVLCVFFLNIHINEHIITNNNAWWNILTVCRQGSRSVFQSLPHVFLLSIQHIRYPQHSSPGGRGPGRYFYPPEKHHPLLCEGKSVLLSCWNLRSMGHACCTIWCEISRVNYVNYVVYVFCFH